ncbi:hypothetical protein [Thermodesulfovibrio hydrogeniphilus]
MFVKESWSTKKVKNTKPKKYLNLTETKKLKRLGMKKLPISLT